MIDFIWNCMAIAVQGVFGCIFIAAIIFVIGCVWDGFNLVKGKLKRDIESKYEKPWDH
jgi:hypothetical protein